MTNSAYRGELFRKGQLVPKRIGNITVHRKARHNVVFNCDVYVNGKNWVAVENSGKSILRIKRCKRRHNNGTFQEIDVLVKGLYVNCSGIDYVVITDSEVWVDGISLG